MQNKGFFASTEVWTGVGLLVAGVAAQAAGVHGIVGQALAPFGIGLILSDVLGRAVKSAREKARVRVRRDDD